MGAFFKNDSAMFQKVHRPGWLKQGTFPVWDSYHACKCVLAGLKLNVKERDLIRCDDQATGCCCVSL